MKSYMTAVIFMSCALITSSATINIMQTIEPKLTEVENKMTINESLKDLQEFIGLEKTGELKNQTHEIMKNIPCGLADNFHFKHTNIRKKRQISNDSVWKSEEVTYRIYRYPKNLTCAAVSEVFEQAFQMWSDVTNLVFWQIDRLADINIGFLPREHVDDHPFKGRKYAQAWPPPIGGIQFYDDVPWSIRNSSGVDLLQIAVHEIGYALGLSNSSNKDSVMWPMREPIFSNKFALHEEDIKRIQALYGKKKNKPPDLCSNSSFDAMFESPSGVIYILKGDYYWKLAPDGIANGYPRLISHRWPGLPGNVDAATALSSGVTYFFKGNKYWIYQDTTPCNSNPYYISVGWPGIPDNLDAVTWRGGSLFYFYKGSRYWEYDWRKYRHLRASYHKPMTDWGGIKGSLDDVMYVTSGYLYLFSDGMYYRYNCKTGLIDYGQPSYPRSVALWWFRCFETNADTGNLTTAITEATNTELPSTVSYSDDYKSSTFTTGDLDYSTTDDGSGSDDDDDTDDFSTSEMDTHSTTAKDMTEYITSTADITHSTTAKDMTVQIESTTDITTDVTNTDSGSGDDENDDTTSMEETTMEGTTMEVTDETTDESDIYIDETDSISTYMTETKITTDTTLEHKTIDIYTTGFGSGDDTDTTDMTDITTDGSGSDMVYIVDGADEMGESTSHITTKETDADSGTTDVSTTKMIDSEYDLIEVGAELITENEIESDFLMAEELSIEVNSWSSDAKSISSPLLVVGFMIVMEYLYMFLVP